MLLKKRGSSDKRAESERNKNDGVFERNQKVLEIIILVMLALKFKKMNKDFMLERLRELLPIILEYSKFEDKFRKLISIIFGKEIN